MTLFSFPDLLSGNLGRKSLSYHSCCTKLNKGETTASVPKAQLSMLKVNVIPRINCVLEKEATQGTRLYFSKSKTKESLIYRVFFIGGEKCVESFFHFFRWLKSHY